MRSQRRRCIYVRKGIAKQIQRLAIAVRGASDERRVRVGCTYSIFLQIDRIPVRGRVCTVVADHRPRRRRRSSFRTPTDPEWIQESRCPAVPFKVMRAFWPGVVIGIVTEEPEPEVGVVVAVTSGGTL
jgi:hypothetical protein